MSVFKSIARNYTAQVFGLLITFANQIAMIPLFISSWGVAKYSDWIIITALSSFFSMTNLGLNQATNNEFVIKYQGKEYDRCQKLLSNSSTFIIAIGLLVILLSYLVDTIWGFKKILNITIFNSNETTTIFVVFLVNVFMKMYGGIYAGIYRVISKSHFNTLIDNFTRVSELLILLIGLVFKFDIIIIMCCFNIPALLSILVRHYQSNLWFKIKMFRLKDFDLPMFSPMIKPSLAFMLFPLGLALSNQGLIFIVKAYLGSSVLVSFTTTRTLINFIKMGTTLVSSSIYPEISNAYGKKNIPLIRKIYKKSYLVSFFILAGSCTFCFFFGEAVFLSWTKSAVDFYSSFFYGMLIAVVISSLWNIPGTILTSTNNHNGFSVVFVSVQLITVVLIYTLLRISSNLFIIPVIMILSEAYILYYTHKKVKVTLTSL